MVPPTVTPPVPSLFPDRVETDRLVLEAVTDDTDPHALYEHLRKGAPGIEAGTRHTTWDPHPHPKATREFVADAAATRADDEGSVYVVRVPDAGGEIAGTTAIEVDWDRGTANLGLWLRKRFWGRGFSGERAAAMLDVAFDTLDLAVVEVTHADGNEKSRRAVERYVERFGGRHEGLLRNAKATLDGDPFDVHRYTVAREEWAANR